MLKGTLQACSALLLELGSEQLRKGVAILGKLFDALVKLVDCHLVLKELSSEFERVIDTSSLPDDRCGCFCGYTRE